MNTITIKLTKFLHDYKPGDIVTLDKGVYTREFSTFGQEVKEEKKVEVKKEVKKVEKKKEVKKITKKVIKKKTTDMKTTSKKVVIK